MQQSTLGETQRLGPGCPHWRLASSQPGSRGEAKLSRARMADAKQCLELFAGREKVNRRERKGGGSKQRVGGWERKKRRIEGNYTEEWPLPPINL